MNKNKQQYQIPKFQNSKTSKTARTTVLDFWNFRKFRKFRKFQKFQKFQNSKIPKIPKWNEPCLGLLGSWNPNMVRSTLEFFGTFGIFGISKNPRPLFSPFWNFWNLLIFLYFCTVFSLTFLSSLCIARVFATLHPHASTPNVDHGRGSELICICMSVQGLGFRV